MQYRVTHNFKTKTSRQKQIKLIFALLIFILCTIIILSVVLLTKKNKRFEDKEIFFVYVDQNTRADFLEDQRELIRELGGAGRIYKFQEKFFLITSVYFSYSDASGVLSNINLHFKNAGILSLRASISNNAKKKLSSEPENIEFIEKFTEIMEVAQKSGLDFLAGNMTESEFCSKVWSGRVEFENLSGKLAEIKDENDIFLKSYKSSVNVLEIFTKFLNLFYQSTKKRAMVSELAVNLVVEYYDFVNNL